MLGAMQAMGASLVIEIPNGREVNQLIGAQGANINALQTETGTHIAIQKASEVMPGSSMRQVTISGADEGARQRCAAIIMQKVMDYQTGTQMGHAQPPAPKPAAGSAGLPDGSR